MSLNKINYDKINNIFNECGAVKPEPILRNANTIIT